jgi:hypothetical protein
MSLNDCGASLWGISQPRESGGPGPTGGGGEEGLSSLPAVILRFFGKILLQNLKLCQYSPSIFFLIHYPLILIIRRLLFESVKTPFDEP